MKFIIEQNGVKRILEGPFTICASKNDFNRLRSFIPDDDWYASYGWVEVHEVIPSVPNTNPIAWDE